MAVIGFSFSKFDCERKQVKSVKNIEINYNIGVKNVEKTPLNVGSSKGEVLRIDFTFDVVYGHELGKISLVGDVIYTDTNEIIAETFKIWQKEKKLNALVNEAVFRFIYNKAVVKALEFADALNLPSPIPLPKITLAKPEK
jgi:hypothetical protein